MPDPHVVIIGGGFGGLYAARELRHAPVRVTVVDRTNHHLFQPLLYQVATALLAPSDIAIPIRWRLHKQRNASVVLAEATSIDTATRTVHLDRSPGTLQYDYLIVATGARHAYFGHDEWEPLAPGLKTLDDAREIRRRFVLAFEQAEWAMDDAERQALLTFVVVGGGPTGVELAGMIPPASRHTLVEEFRNMDTRRTRVILVEAGKRLLATFPDEVSTAANQDLEGIGVEVRLGTPVTRIEPDAVWVGEERIPTRTVFWAAGNAASPLGRTLGVAVDRAGRIPVAPDLSLPGRREVFVIGDLAFLEIDGRVVPAVAPAAMQEGTHAARNIVRDVTKRDRRPFRYRNKGELATIGRHRAVASFGYGRVILRGFVAWWFWLFLHVMYLAGFRNRVSVLIQWAWSYFTWQRGARIVTTADRGDGR
ncbi:MAG TPA: NAD(P)/FAD-dependent oxidoreductase [Gemmatimonadaceae bacterium]|nr:NAD(P)/FAD-dependent oxidoreductase [Gemmatimonadaceae bacterium]